MTSPFNQPATGAGQPENFHPGILNHVLGAIDLLSIGILVLDGESRIIFANRTAKRLLQIRDGQVPGARSHDRRLNIATSRRKHGASRYVSLPAASNGSITALIVPSGEAAGAADPAAVLFVSDPGVEFDIDLESVARLYRLTGAETRLLRALLKGKRVSEYAREARITLNTAKGYLKQLFGKTRTTRQSDLVRTILANPILRLISPQAIEDTPITSRTR